MNISQNMLNNILLNFEKRNMKGYFVEDIPQLIKLIKELVPENSIVGCGDSITLEEAGIYSIFRNGNFIFLDKYKKSLTKKEKRRNLILKIFLPILLSVVLMQSQKMVKYLISMEMEAE